MIFVVVSTGHFDPLIEACNRLSHKYEFLGQVGSSTVKPEFPFFLTASHEKIEECMRQADLIVSHGGAGMTAMINKLKKPSVIVPKQQRYGEANDLQVELAQKWAELGMGVLCLDVDDLEYAIGKAKNTKFNFPEFASLGKHIISEMGLVAPAQATPLRRTSR